MALRLPIVLATTHLEDAHLLALALLENSCANGRTTDQWFSDRYLVAVPYQKNLIENELGAGLGVELLDLNLIPGINPVLLTAGLDHRIHGNTRNLESQRVYK